MPRRFNMLRNNDSKSGEKTIKEGQGHERMDDTMNVKVSREDDSPMASGSSSGSSQFNEESSITNDSPGIRVFNCCTTVPPTVVKYSKIAIQPDARRMNINENNNGLRGGWIYSLSFCFHSAERQILECPTPKDAPRYNMNLSRRGKCVIFNHEHFNPGNGNQRKGTQCDVEAIEKTFGALGFEITIYNDLFWFEVAEEIAKLSKEDYKDCACICIFILTHGNSGGKLSARDASYPFLSIWTPFTADNCSTLFGKPKIFFTQACRGDFYDKSIQGRSETDYDEQPYTLPSQADFLFGYSSMEGYYSIRNEEKGTWYIQTLCNMINEHWMDCDLVKILTMTARKVGIEKSVRDVYTMTEGKQIPVITTTLTRDLYFAPPPP